MSKQLPLTPLLAAALAVVVAGLFFGLVKPKRDQAARLSEEIVLLESRLAVESASSRTAREPVVRIRVADLFRLAKAMPDKEDMSGIILELDAVATSAGIEFRSIQPQSPVALPTFQALPINLTFEGNYYDLTDFLFRLRNLVTVEAGRLEAEGRLYALDALDLHEAQEGFPTIEAALTISAFRFGAPAVQTAVSPAEAGGR